MKLGRELEMKGTGSGILLFSIFSSVGLFLKRGCLLCHPTAYYTKGKKAETYYAVMWSVTKQQGASILTLRTPGSSEQGFWRLHPGSRKQRDTHKPTESPACNVEPLHFKTFALATWNPQRDCPDNVAAGSVAKNDSQSQEVKNGEGTLPHKSAAS